jgi:hypothetical protein
VTLMKARLLMAAMVFAAFAAKYSGSGWSNGGW